LSEVGKGNDKQKKNYSGRLALFCIYDFYFLRETRGGVERDNKRFKLSFERGDVFIAYNQERDFLELVRHRVRLILP
jgi:hypothetical protein